MRLHRLIPLGLGLVLVATAAAKKISPSVLVWPPTGQSVVRFSFSSFKVTVSAGKRRDYETEVTIKNVWDKRISSAKFTLYFFDKEKIRIAEAVLDVHDLAPGQVTEFQALIPATGLIASMELVPRSLPEELQGYDAPQKISITVNSEPQGAQILIDGAPAGTTPKIIEAAPGKHLLTFSKEGFSPGTLPVEISPEDVSGRSVSYELVPLGHDTLELRDGAVLSGDVLSMSATEVEIRINGSVQHFSRKQVKRIVLVPREAESQ